MNEKRRANYSRDAFFIDMKCISSATILGRKGGKQDDD